MRIQGQLGQERQTGAHAGAPPLFYESFLSESLNSGLLGNASTQTISHFVDVIVSYWDLLYEAGHAQKLSVLKSQRFTPEGKRARMEASLTALYAAQPTDLTAEQWKAILEEVEDEDC